MSDLLHAAKQILARHENPNIHDATSAPTVVSLARYYVVTHPDDPHEPASVEWLRSRDWRIYDKGDGTYGAQLKGGSVGPFNQFCQIDELGCSFTAIRGKDAVKWNLAGFPLDNMPQMYAWPICKGWPTRKQVIAIEQLFRSLVG